MTNSVVFELIRYAPSLALGGLTMLCTLMSNGIHFIMRRYQLFTGRRKKAGEELSWIGEWDGKPVVRLSNPHSEDMFWESYGMEIISDDPKICDMLQNSDFWSGNDCLKLLWRNSETNRVAPCALPASRSNPFTGTGRLLIRGLHT